MYNASKYDEKSVQQLWDLRHTEQDVKEQIVKDCKNEDVNSLMVESRLNIFHSKFYWRIFCNTDSWISCLKFTQILRAVTKLNKAS